MSESREEAIKRLQDSASALEARTTVEKSAELTGHQVSGQAYKIIAELLGGVFVGLAAGFLAGWGFGTRPWGLVGGGPVGLRLVDLHGASHSQPVDGAGQGVRDVGSGRSLCRGRRRRGTIGLHGRSDSSVSDSEGHRSS